jgi:peptidoglycan/xylan/chitin deacetylase (PgdA/CDA1 family)
MFAFLNRKKAVVLMYHGVSGGDIIPGRSQDHVPVEVFRRQMAYLAAHRNVVPLRTLIQWLRDGREIPEYTVAISFDDGYRNNFVQAYPILRHYHLPATIFLVTGFIDTDQALWPDRLAYAIHHATCSELSLNGVCYPLRTNRERTRTYRKILLQAKRLGNAEKERLIESLVQKLGADLNTAQHDGHWNLLTWSQVREMRKDRITFGAHTENHVILTRVPPEEAETEIRCSKQALEEQLAAKITLFCYPNGKTGDFNRATRQMLLEAGFQGAVVNLPGLVALGDDPFTVKRVSIRGDGGFWTFVASLSGLLAMLQAQVERLLRSTRRQTGESGLSPS